MPPCVLPHTACTNHPRNNPRIHKASVHAFYTCAWMDLLPCFWPSRQVNTILILCYSLVCLMVKGLRIVKLLMETNLLQGAGDEDQAGSLVIYDDERISRNTWMYVLEIVFLRVVIGWFKGYSRQPWAMFINKEYAPSYVCFVNKVGWP